MVDPWLNHEPLPHPAQGTSGYPCVNYGGSMVKPEPLPHPAQGTGG